MLTNKNKNDALSVYADHTFCLGIVEDNKDPFKMGRIRVRIPSFDLYKEPDSLTWALPCFSFGGGRGYGSLMVPIEGSSVLVHFVGQDLRYPIYFGSLVSITNEEQRLLRATNDKEFEYKTKQKFNMTSDADTTWVTQAGHEAPYEFLEQTGSEPDQIVLLKTPKGATISINERDEAESLSIIDRSGQSLVFSSKVIEKSSNSDIPSNTGNSAQRGRRNSIGSHALPKESLVGESASIVLADVTGQHLEINSEPNNNKITLCSKETATQVPYHCDDTNKAEIEINASQNAIILKVNRITTGSSTSSYITINNSSGTIEISTDDTVIVRAGNISLVGDVSITGNVSINGSITTTGNISAAGSVEATQQTSQSNTITINPYG